MKYRMSLNDLKIKEQMDKVMEKHFEKREEKVKDFYNSLTKEQQQTFMEILSMQKNSWLSFKEFIEGIINPDID